MSDQEKEGDILGHWESKYPFSHIKPHKVGDYMGFPSVLEIVSKEVRQVLDLLELPGSYIEIVKPRVYLFVSGQAPIIINNDFIDQIKPWCNQDGPIYKIHPQALNYIKKYKR